MARSESIVSERLAETLRAAQTEPEPEPEPTEPKPGEPQPEPEPEPTPQPEPPASEPSAELLAKRLDKEMTRHEKTLRGILEIEEPLRDAPYEGVIGFLLPGMASYQPNEKFKACDTCAGMGDVLTGSFKTGNETQPCPRCGGRGYLEKVQRVETPAGPVGALAAGNGSEDEYGTPTWLGDPNLTPQS